MAEEKKSIHKTKNGRVISDRMQKTVVVEVETAKRHALYGRTVRFRAKFKAHDENQEAHTGDLVRIEETRPLSREKRWRVVEILRKAEQF
ncbi:MAG: 30S ribosomal protein S17 [Chloroflexota bacterium]